MPIQPPGNEVRYIPIEAVKPQQFVGSPGLAAQSLPIWHQQWSDSGRPQGPAERQRRAREAALCGSRQDNQGQAGTDLLLESAHQSCKGRRDTRDPDPAQGVGMTASGLAGADASLFKTAQVQRGTTQQPQWSTWGELRLSPFKSENGQPMYVLNQKGQPPLVRHGTDRNVPRELRWPNGVFVRPNHLPQRRLLMRRHQMVATHIALPYVNKNPKRERGRSSFPAHASVTFRRLLCTLFRNWQARLGPNRSTAIDLIDGVLAPRLRTV